MLLCVASVILYFHECTIEEKALLYMQKWYWWGRSSFSAQKNRFYLFLVRVRQLVQDQFPTLSISSWCYFATIFIGKHVPLELQNSQNFLSCNVTAQEEPMPWNIKLKSMHEVAAEGYSKRFHTGNFAN